MVPLTVSQGRSKNHTDCPVVWWMTLSRLRCYKSWCHRAQGWAKIATTDLSTASKPRVAIRVQWWHWIMWCDFKKHGTKSNLCKKKRPTEASILAGSVTPSVANIWYYLTIWDDPNGKCNAKDNQAHRELVCKQCILLLSCYAVTKSTLLLMFICFIILIIEDAPIQANQPCAKGTFPQLRGTGRGIKRDILQRFVASVHGPFCRWSIGLLAVEKVESWRKKKK